MPKDSVSSPSSITDAARDYTRVRDAIAYVLERHEDQPSLDAIAARVGLSSFHFQRLFTRWAGVSPKRFLSYVTVEHAKARLEKSASVLEAALASGLSGPSRLHDMMVSVEAITPGEYKAQGSDLEIRYGVAPTPYGDALFLVSARGLCGLDFIDDDLSDLMRSARDRWPLSRFVDDSAAARTAAGQVFSEAAPVSLLLKGTPWQTQVWTALLRIPAGTIASYGQVAEAVCSRRASRAVGTAVAANHIGYVIPCHRVLRSTGLFKRHRWGAPRRWAMLAKEASAV